MNEEEGPNAMLPNFSNWMRTSADYTDDVNSQSDDDSVASDNTSDNAANYDISDHSDPKFNPRINSNTNTNTNTNGDANANVNNGQTNRTEAFTDDGMAVGQGHRHGATVYDDWGLPISNPNNFREGRNMCRPWLVLINLLAIGLVAAIILHGGPTSDYEYRRYNWYGQDVMDEPDTTWKFLGEDLIGPTPDRHEAENRLVGFGHHVAMNEEGDRIAVARTSGHGNSPGEVYVYSWKDGSKHKHNHPPTPGKWRLEQVLTAELTEEDMSKFHTGQQHTPLAMSASGHRIAFTEGDHVFIYESPNLGDTWEQIAKVQSLDHDYEEEVPALAPSKVEEVMEEDKNVEEVPEEDENATDQDTAKEGEEKPVQAVEGEPTQESDPEEQEEHRPVDLYTDHSKPTTAVAPKTVVAPKKKSASAEDPAAASDEDDDDDDDDDDEYDDDDDDDDDDVDTRKLAKTDWERSGSHFGKHLAFSHDGKTLAVMGFSKAKGGYIRVFQDETEDIYFEDHEEVRHEFEPTPDIFLEELGDSLALSGDGKTIAIGIATSDALGVQEGTHTGLVQVFAVNKFNQEWSRIGQPIFGEYAMEGFGGTVSLSEDGLVLAVGVAFGGGPVRIYEITELDRLGHKFEWTQRGQTLTGANHREHFGAQVRLNYDGTFVAIGAPGSPDMLDSDEPIDENMVQYLHGQAYLFEFSKDDKTWMDGGHAMSSYEGDAFGYSLAVSGDGERVVVGAPFRIVNDELNVGVVQIFGGLED